MKRFVVIWTYVANYGRMTIEANNPTEAAERVYAGFSEEFRQKGTCYVVPENQLTTFGLVR